MRQRAGVRGCFVAGCTALLAACGGGGGGAAETQARPVPSASRGLETAAAGDAPADTSALAAARRILRTAAVQHAIEVPMGAGRRFVAAAVPASAAFRTEPAKGHMEIVLLDIYEGGNQILRPGLFADSLGSGGRISLARTMGAEDVTGDGKGEVWAAARMMGGRSWALELWLYDHITRGLYSIGANTGIDDERRLDVVEYSENTARQPRIRAWLARKAGAVAGDLAGTPMKVDTLRILHQARRP
ncbi:MAG TPA: hypothetical protein VFQ45_22985 [Longimicrobium sp.]|nr:hypothetical protein [Longimicrobium sp.]